MIVSCDTGRGFNNLKEETSAFEELQHGRGPRQAAGEAVMADFRQGREREGIDGLWALVYWAFGLVTSFLAYFFLFSFFFAVS